MQSENIIVNSAQIQQTKCLLSQKFLDLVKKLLTKKRRAMSLKIINIGNDRQHAYDNIIEDSKNILLLLREIIVILIVEYGYESKINDTNRDEMKFNIDVCENILNDDVLNYGYVIDGKIHIIWTKDDGYTIIHEKSLSPEYLQNLNWLDILNQETQDIFNQCLDSFDENYIISNDMYDQIEKNIGSVENIYPYSKIEENIYPYSKIIVLVHHTVITHRICNVWESNETKYENEQKLFRNMKPYNFQNTQNINEYKIHFQYSENLVKEYSNINLLEH